LKALAEKRDEYVLIMANIEETNEIISDNSDADMTKWPNATGRGKERLPELEEEIKFMLIKEKTQKT
jgi:peptide chain release factor 1